MLLTEGGCSSERFCLGGVKITGFLSPVTLTNLTCFSFHFSIFMWEVYLHCSLCHFLNVDLLVNPAAVTGQILSESHFFCGETRLNIFPKSCLKRIDAGLNLDFFLELLKTWIWVRLGVPWSGAADYSVLKITWPAHME